MPAKVDQAKAAAWDYAEEAQMGDSGTESMGWQKAVAALTAECGRAETAASVIKRLGDPADIAVAELTYGGGRAESDAVVSALIVALEQGRGAEDLADLEARLTEATAARETLARQAQTLAKELSSEKSVVVDLLVQALPNLLAALGALWSHWVDRDAGTRATIAGRLEAARWPPFAEIGKP